MTYKIKFIDETNCYNECYKTAQDLLLLVAYLDAHDSHYVQIESIEHIANDSKLVSIM